MSNKLSDAITALNRANYKQRGLECALLWVDGESQHNKVDDECCPDFSCCHPELFEKDKDKRIAQFNQEYAPSTIDDFRDFLKLHQAKQ